MSNRLKFYREQMAAFEGTVDPRKAIESGYYVPEPRKSSSSIITRAALRPSARHLLLGGIGSGKTTQLLVACDQLNDIEGIYARYIDVNLHTDMSDISSNILTAITGVILSEITQNNRDIKLNEYQNIVKKYAHGYSEDVVLESPFQSIHKSISGGLTRVKHKGILSPKLSPLEEAIKYLSKVASSKYGDLIFLFDGLDRINDAYLFAELVINVKQFISSSGIGVVLVGPLVSAYSQYRDIIESAVNFTRYQPCFDLENDLDARSFFEKILSVRSRENFIETSALQGLVSYSGGVLRDLINLTQSSIEEAYISDEETLNQNHVKAAADSFGRAKLLGISDQDLEILKQVAQTGKFIPRTDEEVRLLVTGRVLEYQYPAKRFAVHPTLQPLL
jgi:hypothetical protein